MGSEASGNSFQCLFYLGEELVWGVGDDSGREVINKTRIGSFVEPSGGCW